MHFRATAARLAFAGAALAAFTLTAPGLPSAQAAATDLHASPSAAKPGVAVVVTGKIPDQANMPFTVTQIYTDFNIARVQQNEPMGGVAGSDGKVKATVTVPAKATRSDILRPYGSWQYDVVAFNFGPGCKTGGIECTSYGVSVNVLPVRTDEHIALATLAPRTGSSLHAHVTNCVGVVATEFARVIDGNGSYFPFEGSVAGTTYDGSADLSSGFRGKYGPQGAAHVSSPIGIRDSLAAVPCTQSEGPASVASADNLEHLSMVIDITICPRTGSCAVSSAIAPAGQTPVFGPRGSSTTTSFTVTPAALPAQAITAEPTFVG